MVERQRRYRYKKKRFFGPEPQEVVLDPPNCAEMIILLIPVVFMYRLVVQLLLSSENGAFEVGGILDFPVQKDFWGPLGRQIKNFNEI